ncbi:MULTISPECIES: biotin/lipoyl-containing protein, partial [unclassified Nocardia]
LALVGTGVDIEDFAADPGRYDIPDSVIGFLRGELGEPAGGWPEPFRSKALAGRNEPKPETPLTAADQAGLDGTSAERRHTLNRLLFPGPTAEFQAHREKYGDISRLSANQFFYGLRPDEEHNVVLDKGVTLLIRLQAISEPDERGMRSVLCQLNGQLRQVAVRDRSVADQVAAAEKADPTDPAQLGAPFSGVVTLAAGVGERVAAGDTVATIEAMKMEATITAPRDGVIDRVAIKQVQQVDGGDLLLVIATE